MIKKVELLAPAGNKEGYIGALNAGADAIYLGGEKFSARAYAENFEVQDIIDCIRLGHLYGVRTYLTVNTLVKKGELRDFFEYLVPLYENGLDGVIVQDLGCASLIPEYFPDMELHISTQMTITGRYGAAYLKRMGAVRLVPARECSLKDLKALKQDCGMEIECFVHGAMCYCYSGQCLMSSVLGGRSGNRGRCAGPCRLPYRAEGQNERSYPLSLKDLCTVELVPQLIKAGIDSFKIEGRMKKPEYTAGVTAVYRKYIDKFYQNPNAEYKVDKKDNDFLRKLYIRSEIQDGYYLKHNGKEMITFHEGGYLGTDDGILQEIRSTYIDNPMKLPVNMKVILLAGQKAYVEVRCKEFSMTTYGEFVEKAKNRGLNEKDIEKQMRKLGNTPFGAEEIQVITDGTSFYPVKEMNELRRQVITLLEDKMIEQQGYAAKRKFHREIDVEERYCSHAFTYLLDCKNTTHENWGIEEKNIGTEKADRGFTVLIQTREQLEALLKLPVYFTNNSLLVRVYVEESLFGETSQKIKESLLLLQRRLCDSRSELIIALPFIIDWEHMEKLNEVFSLTYDGMIQGVLVRNLEELEYLKEHGYTGKIYSDTNLYAFNQASVAKLLEDVDGYTYPVELSRKEERDLFEGTVFEGYGEKIVYGRTLVMTSANCIFKSFDRCKGKGVHYSYIEDRKGIHFPVKIDCNYCNNGIYNSVPLSLHKDMEKRYRNVCKRISFTVESREETKRILEFFLGSYGTGRELPFDQFTTGHSMEGVL